MAYNNVHLPVGYEIAVQTDPSVAGVFTDLGVTMDDGEVVVSYDELKITGSQAEGILHAIKNPQIQVTASLGQIELSNVHKLMSGATAYASVAASPVGVTDEDYLAGAWALNTFIPFVHQNGAGTVPSTITVANYGALTLDTDYTISVANGIWGITVLDTATTDIAETLEINYTYTPSASRTLTMGSASVAITPRAFRIRKLLASGKYFTVTIHSGVNSSGLTLAFPRYDTDDITKLPITITGSIDATRADLDQLFSISDSYGIVDN